jgi:hypothetical protein
VLEDISVFPASEEYLPCSFDDEIQKTNHCSC